MAGIITPSSLPVSKKNRSIVPNPSVLVLLLVVLLVFMLVSCCCRCLHRLCCCIANAADAAVDTKCISPAVAAVITNAVALTAAITALVASAVAPRCNHRRLAVAVAVTVARVMARLVAAVAAMSGCRRQRTCSALVEGHRSNDNALLGLSRSAWLASLGLLHSAHVKIRLLTSWRMQRAHNAGRRLEWGQRHLLR